MNNSSNHSNQRSFLQNFLVALLLALFGIFGYLSFSFVVSGKEVVDSTQAYIAPDSNFSHVWTAPSDWRLMHLKSDERELVEYGRELIANTSEYLGPQGSVSPISNGMNCQNCHLNAGTQPWGNNYFAVQSTYPKFRARSGSIEDQVKRVNDCFERSLNGQALAEESKEMRSILAYIKWLGSDVEKGISPKGSGIFKLKGLKRPIDSTRGAEVYVAKCQSCHQADGGGLLAPTGKSYTYPPLWGEHSYNHGAGLYRMSNFAGYVKYNMPLGATYDKPQLTDEEAWDLAAYVNSMPRPSKDLRKDWPDIAGKPFDHPFGPYADPFTEKQHKYGPYKPIKEWIAKHKKSKK
jgi:thiosulfate dehydrogenase